MPDHPRFNPARVEVTHNYSESSLLHCPGCREFYLHQGKITVYERGEDEETTVVTTVDHDRLSRAKLVSESSGNPSRRRHGLTIDFDCEHCGTVYELCIAQHKGETELSWRPSATKSFWSGKP